ncbi:MAG: phenylacetate-CoA oxygenase subunit PaaC [Alphaproteobacteria bacterium]|jgi:ring-1,2-phenylacetyl-CoA epoxidase subunit PaaC|nr:phenylacetate-CoA oxygenase subunit PaaC [Alphaproteobacteria bacterium]
MDQGLFSYLLRQGDSCLILGHRLSEWCGHAPQLELDIALANIALDLTGQADAFLGLAAEVEGQGRDADALAFHRDVLDYRNLLLVELPNEDFGLTIARQFLFDAWQVEFYGALARSSDQRVAALAAKGLREATYHERFSGEWLVRLGDGTDESHARAQAAIDELWTYTGEMFECDALVAGLVERGIAPDHRGLKAAWDARVADVLAEATLRRPADGWMQSGGLKGRHGEALGHLLAEMQFLPRAYPGARW